MQMLNYSTSAKYLIESIEEVLALDIMLFIRLPLLDLLVVAKT